MNKNKSVLVLGATGLVGGSLVRALKATGYTRILAPKRTELDLFNHTATKDYFANHKPDYVLFAAAKVGGILANNTARAEFIHKNLLIQTNVFEATLATKVERLVFLGSSCIYPKLSKQPIREEYLLSGPLEPTNEPYAIAKIAGLKTVSAFRNQYGFDWFSAMPTNLYGPGDNFSPSSSHVIPGLIRRMHDAKVKNQKVFEVWGSGNPRREFLFVDDLADACIFLMENFKPVDDLDWINIGAGQDISIRELSQLVAQVVGFKGDLIFDTTKPDGTPQKLLDSSNINQLGWKPKVDLLPGLTVTYNWFLQNAL